MATMPHPRLYNPDYDLTEPVPIGAEIEFLWMMMDTLDPTDPTYEDDRAYYENHINNLSERLPQAQPAGYSPAAMSGVLTPGSATDWGEISRKRPLSVSDNEQRSLGNSGPSSPGTSVSLNDSMPGAWPGWKRPRTNFSQVGGDVVDLTDDQPLPPPRQPLTYPPQPPLPPAYLDNFPVDPFAELFHVRQPVLAQNAPANAFVQESMGLDELAEFMMTPTPAGGGYPYNQPAQPQRFAPLAVPPLSIGVPGVGLPNRTRDWAMPPPQPPGPDNGDRHVVDSIIQNIKCQDVSDMPREQTPKEMSCVLMEHQKQALAWLLNMETGGNKGSILADEMGLGKTIEGLALILANPPKNPARKTTLIVAPVALMRQWEKELERHVKSAHRLRVYVYHRNGKKADWNMLREYDIVLTTFNTLAMEQKRIDTRREAEAAVRELQEANFTRTAKDRLGLLDPQCYWYRVILDEAQCIKNRNTLTSKAAAALTAEHRLCMTGTPMQNSVEELYPLIRFLRMTAYQTWTKFNDDIAKPLKSKHEYTQQRGMARLQALIKSITLRREKTTIVDGRPVVDLPPKHMHIRPVDFNDDEIALYKAVETKSQLTFNAYLKRGTVSNNYANILTMILRLRQICCHPHLIKDLAVQVSTDGIAEKDLKTRTKELSQDVVRRLKDKDDGFECPICYETEINPTIIIPCGHQTCGECFQKLIDPTRAIQDGNENGSKCPNCRGILSSDRITDYRHFCKVFCPGKYDELRRAILGDEGNDAKESHTDGSDEDESSDDEDDEDANDPTLGGFIVIVDDNLDDDVEMGNSGAPGPSRKKKKGKGKAKKQAGEDKHSLAELKKLGLRSAKAKQKYFRRLRKDFKSSAKIQETMRLLGDIRANDPNEKTLIFSSFTTLLDLLEVPMQNEKYKYQRYDGSMKFDDRVEAVNDFMDKPGETVMLISIKAGNAGLNLNKASQVIMLDPFWNPFVEDQAVDRAHRMPQKRDVHVHRVLVPETIEDRICALQDKKRDTIQEALDEGAGKSLTRLTVNELRNLFNV